MSFETDVIEVTEDIAALLIEKNKAYGNSALDPVRIFSKADPLEQLQVRIDDKLSRLARGNEYPGDDTITDLLGYLILYKIQTKRTKPESNTITISEPKHSEYYYDTERNR